MRPFRMTLLISLLSAAVPALGVGLDYQVHGFAAQGYLLSEGNNFFGDSTNGSHDYYEAALNGSINLGGGLLASAQGLIRDAGPSDTGRPRLDYALIDWNVVQSVQTSGGLRFGRVKNPLGLYNDTRDVIFARPSILLPHSVYFEGAGLRNLVFSSDGGQLYGSQILGGHEGSLTITAALDRDLSKKERQVLVVSGPVPDEIRLKELLFSQLQDSWDGGRLRLAASYAHATLAAGPDPNFPVDLAATFNLYVFSVRYNAERYSLISEYIYNRLKTRSRVMGRTASSSDGGYLQAEYRPTAQWSIYTRYDSTFSDADDRDGSEAAASSGADRYSRFAHDLSVGAGWRPDAHWGLWAELHRIYGTATAPPLDNPDGAEDERWTLLTLMAGYRF